MGSIRSAVALPGCSIGIDDDSDDRCDALAHLINGVNEDVRDVASLLFASSDKVYPADPNCEEKAPATKSGNEVFYDLTCCSTAKAKVMQIEEKMEYCDDRDMCWKSLKTVLPKALAHYKAQVKTLCVTTTTTTTTTMTTTTTKPVTTSAPANSTVTKPAAATEAVKEAGAPHPDASTNSSSDDAVDADADDDDSGEDDNSGVFDHDWCVKKCMKEKVEKKACNKLCNKVHDKVEGKVKKAMDKQASEQKSKYEKQLSEAKANATKKGNKSCLLQNC